MKARRRFGQHFLEAQWAARVLDAAAPAEGDAFLEIGPGRGALTIALAKRVAQVVAVEIDRELAASLARRAPPNVRVVTADILAVDVAALLEQAPRGCRRRVIGNLPYNVSTPILFALLAASRGGQAIDDAIVMVQREVADRLLATPGGRDYGVLTIFAQAGAAVSRLVDLPPGAFRPAPRVHSTVVRLAFGVKRVPQELAGTFSAMIRSIFTRRRKILANALKPFGEGRGVAPGLVLARAGLDGSRRPETLQLEELVRLAAVFATTGEPPVL